MFKNLNLASVAILLGVTKGAGSTNGEWNRTDTLLCNGAFCNSDIDGDSTYDLNLVDGSWESVYWPLTASNVKTSGVCNSDFKCSKGWGPCDSDSVCRGNLVCGQRNGFESLPGLTGLDKPTTLDPNGDVNYCYDPNFQVSTENAPNEWVDGWEEHDYYAMNTTIQKDESYVSRIKMCANS